MNYALIAILKTPGGFDELLTYVVPEGLKEKLQRGQLVLVPLKDKQVRGVIVELMEQVDVPFMELKEIEGVVEWSSPPEKTQKSKKRAPESVSKKEGESYSYSYTPPLLEGVHLELAKKMSQYYHYSLLRCLKLMVPKHLWKGTGVGTIKKFFKIEKSAEEKLPKKQSGPPFKYQLTLDQQEALVKIQQAQKPVLLQGVTGSGKTELYLRLIAQSIEKEKQAILLLPEIALTPQMLDYFSAYFDGQMAIFHSKLSDGKRLEEWLKVKTGQAKLVIGSRSAIFAPVRDLGILIIDEEHEWTYKQESSPYYQTHQVAEMLRELTGGQLVLGTATPRLETLFKSKVGQYEHVALPLRINQQALPQVEVVDLRQELQKKNYSIFSHLLFDKIQDRLEKKEQVILFVNQRGVARAVMCRDCGQTLVCPRCEVSLKLHHPDRQQGATLMCHYCSYQQPPVLSCPYCESVNIKQVGIGTQRVEQDLRKAIPGIRVIRADKDTTSDKAGFEPIYQAFKAQEYDVLVGTQMVAKGHDFPKVTLIGIILADVGLHVPDFRSHERLFQLITQVSGRAGRAEQVGEVVLQTYQPEHPAIQYAANYQFEAFAEQEFKFRQKHHYPPFAQLIKFTVLGKDLQKLQQHLQAEQETLEDITKTHQLEAYFSYAPALIPKLGEFYYYHFLVRSPEVQKILAYWKIPKAWRIDVDPVHTA